ncbi:Hypothetical protein GLP15_5215 [Giardia lamblia P15]|uniref:Sm domain-containing protein n=1 Tax=Giardia intestinalis (strain P15) TaxID=658858 RepID=E1EWE4_GIAIA|nr:Hypothetical protein GLP15_5215 [Giardia lamblia P15]
MTPICGSCEAGPAGFKYAVGRPVLVVTAAGPQYFGTLTHYDGFGNVLLKDTAQRITNGTSYADIPMGWVLVRGDDIFALLVDPVVNPALQREDDPKQIFPTLVDAHI